MNKRTSYTCSLTPRQSDDLRERLEVAGWELDTVPYSRWRARKNKTTVVSYESGKLVVQGKGTADLVQFTLEPEILKEARFGYEDVLHAEEHPEMFEPHAGIDESGKGDYFGPLVIAAVYVDETVARQLVELGTTDSKKIKSDRRIASLAEEIRTAVRGQFNVVPIGPEAYNRLYEKIGNLNRLLAWGHARVLENLLDRVPACPRAVSDQFGRKDLVKNALMNRGRSVRLEQMPRAEADVAVAAASILARAEFVRRLEALGEPYRLTLPKGAGPAVNQVARDIVSRKGPDALRGLVKLHFKTTARVLAESESK